MDEAKGPALWLISRRPTADIDDHEALMPLPLCKR